jgi:hypothetical protein
MSSSKNPRIKKGPVSKKFKRRKYRDALPELILDSGGRCAYSMQHQVRSGTLEVDHFDPRRKNELWQYYNNLFPASRHCNGRKSDTWPSKTELAAGCRFLNPREEMDYGEQIFEDATTNKLVGMTPAAIWHIRICGLNADRLVEERRRRAKHWGTIRDRAIILKKGVAHEAVQELINRFIEEVRLMIPEIPPVPASAA